MSLHLRGCPTLSCIVSFCLSVSANRQHRQVSKLLACKIAAEVLGSQDAHEHTGLNSGQPWRQYASEDPRDTRRMVLVHLARQTRVSGSCPTGFLILTNERLTDVMAPKCFVFFHLDRMWGLGLHLVTSPWALCRTPFMRSDCPLWQAAAFDCYTKKLKQRYVMSLEQGSLQQDDQG